MTERQEMEKVNKSLVLLSGGADSAIAAIVAKRDSKEVHALTLNYGQEHHVETSAASQVAQILGLEKHEILNLPPNTLLGDCGLINPDLKIPTYSKVDELPTDEIAKTFLPLRNQLLVTIAMNRVLVGDFDRLYLGVSQTDYSGYPDCRNDFIVSIDRVSQIGYMGKDEYMKKINTLIFSPLMFMDKCQSVLYAHQLIGDEDRFEEIFGHTHTCYRGVKGGCGTCAACLLRDRGFEEAKMIDPIWKFRKAA